MFIEQNLIVRINNMANQFATVFNPQTGERKKVTVGDPNAFAGGFELETQAPQAQQQAPQQGQEGISYTEILNNTFDNPDWDFAQQQVNQAQENVSSDIYSNIATKDKYLQSLQKERSGLVSDITAGAAGIRADFEKEYSDIFDPIQREAMISQAMGNIMGQYSQVQSEIENRGGTLEQQANNMLKFYEKQLSTAKDEKDDMRTLLLNIANKNYDAAQDVIDRQRDLKDSITLKQTPTYGDTHPSPDAPTPVSTTELAVYDKNGTQVAIRVRNPKTNEIVFTDLFGNALAPETDTTGWRLGGTSMQPITDESLADIANKYGFLVGAQPIE